MSARSAPTRPRASAAARLLPPLAAVALLFACSDAPPTAPARAPEAPNIAAPPRATKGEEVTITRTTEIALTPRGLKGERTSSRRVKRFARELHQASRDEPASALARALPRAERPRLDELPPAGLSVTAMPVMLHDAGQRWARRGPVAGEPGVVVEAEGTGDRPADVMRFRRDGVLLFTIRQDYERRGGRWALRHRETIAADGHFRDVVDAEWTGTPVEDGAAATRHLLLGQLGRVRAPAQHPATTLAALDDAEDCCRDKAVAAETAFEAFLFADATALAICAMTPPPADVLACAVATGKAVEKYLEFSRKVAERDACYLNPPKCREEVIVGITGGGTSQDGGGWTDSSLTICWYEYWYDVNTGEVFSWQLLYCEKVA